jgi:hypothetical protein
VQRAADLRTTGCRFRPEVTTSAYFTIGGQKKNFSLFCCFSDKSDTALLHDRVHDK